MANGINGDLSKGWVKITAVAGIVAIAVSLTVTGTTMNNKLDAQGQQLVALTVKVDALPSSDRILTSEREIERLNARIEVLDLKIQKLDKQIAVYEAKEGR